MILSIAQIAKNVTPVSQCAFPLTSSNRTAHNERSGVSEFSSSICVDEESLDLTVSVGIASFPECASNSIELRKCADIALYRAKEKGRNQAQFYSKAFHEQMNRRAELERHLKKALVKSEMELYYQPQFNADMKLIGAEALLRWKHPQSRGRCL